MFGGFIVVCLFVFTKNKIKKIILKLYSWKDEELIIALSISQHQFNHVCKWLLEIDWVPRSYLKMSSHKWPIVLVLIPLLVFLEVYTTEANCICKTLYFIIFHASNFHFLCIPWFSFLIISIKLFVVWSDHSLLPHAQVSEVWHSSYPLQ